MRFYSLSPFLRIDQVGISRIVSAFAQAIVLAIVAGSGLGDDSAALLTPSDDSPKRALPEEGGRTTTQCDAKLVVASEKVPIGKNLEFTITITNSSDKAFTVLNPTFSPLARIATIDLLIVDGDGKSVGELYRVGRAFEGSSQHNASWFWQTLPARKKIEKTDQIRLSVLKAGKEQLKPGKYRLQMVFFDKFLSEYPYEGLPPRRIAGSEAYRDADMKWLEKYTGKESFRSNSVDIELH